MNSACSVSEVVPDARETPAEVAAAVTGASDVMAQCAPELFGHTDFVSAPDYLLHRMTHRVHFLRPLFVATSGPKANRPEDVLGYAFMELPLADNRHLVQELDLEVRPDARRHGVGTALLDATVAYARRHDRTHLVGWGSAPIAERDDPEALRSRTDPLVAARTAGGAFALARGFHVAQIERYSVLGVQASAPTPPRRVAGYGIRCWLGATPAGLRDGVASLLAAFSEDAPVGDSAFGSETWDAERLAAVEAASAEIVERCTAVALHEATGELVGISQLIRDRGRGGSAEQGVTVVRGDHRGHGLGLALKQANLAAAVDSWTHLQRIHTWNAGENDHMWRINEILGYRTAGVAVCWQRTL